MYGQKCVCVSLSTNSMSVSIYTYKEIEEFSAYDVTGPRTLVSCCSVLAM